MGNSNQEQTSIEQEVIELDSKILGVKCILVLNYAIRKYERGKQQEKIKSKLKKNISKSEWKYITETEILKKFPGCIHLIDIGRWRIHKRTSGLTTPEVKKILDLLVKANYLTKENVEKRKMKAIGYFVTKKAFKDFNTFKKGKLTDLKIFRFLLPYTNWDLL